MATKDNRTLAANNGEILTVGGTLVAAEDRGTLDAEDGGTLTAEDRGTLTAEDRGTLTAEDGGIFRAGGSGPASQANAGPIISVRNKVKIVSSTSLYSSDFTAVARRIVTTVWLPHNLWLLLPHNVLLQVSRLVIPLINQEIYLILRFHLASLK